MTGDTKYKMNIKKGSVSITLYARKGISEITIFYLKAKIYSSEVLSPQEANRNLSEEKKYQYRYDKKEYYQKKLGLPSETDIDIVHRYSHIGETLLDI